MADISKLESFVHEMEEELSLLEKEILDLRDFHISLLSNRETILKQADRNKYNFKNGFSTNRPGKDSTLSSIALLRSDEDFNKRLLDVFLTNRLDSAFSKIYYKYDFIAQVYTNSSKQISRVFPAYDIEDLISQDIDVTSFNFYYKGNAENNPTRGPVWIPEVYVDPVGRGWILSLIQPVYHNDSLYAVLGIDITVDEIISRYLEKGDEDYLIVTKNGDIVAGNSESIELLSFPPLRNHVYRETIQEDNFRISDFNLFNSKNQEVREMAEKLLFEGQNHYFFNEIFSPYSAYKVSFDLLDWILIEINPTPP
ncbi:MAG: Cache sensor protein [Algoriphagus sp.]|uniref:cache domain-containing protein n=1 Tax=Algoriphagus sp. TaxID=1872435 RepID=UPI002610ECD8|nr:Cache sensor protein [Algoriphagus sp.]MDG1276381.1 Cache sensor protein [Algoriphagus sp.]